MFHLEQIVSFLQLLCIKTILIPDDAFPDIGRPWSCKITQWLDKWEQSIKLSISSSHKTTPATSVCPKHKDLQIYRRDVRGRIVHRYMRSLLYIRDLIFKFRLPIETRSCHIHCITHQFLLFIPYKKDDIIYAEWCDKSAHSTLQTQFYQTLCKF